MKIENLRKRLTPQTKNVDGTVMYILKTDGDIVMESESLEAVRLFSELHYRTLPIAE